MFPGHGTPTYILFGRGAKPSQDGMVTVTATHKGDLRTQPEDSPLWQSTVAHHMRAGYRDEWVSVTQRPAGELNKHPWILETKHRQHSPGYSWRPVFSLEACVRSRSADSS